MFFRIKKSWDNFVPWLYLYYLYSINMKKQPDVRKREYYEYKNYISG